MSKSVRKILTTAERLFNQNNFTSVGVDLIRDESGCSKTTMYTYFKNKQQLIFAILKQRDSRFRDSIVQYIGESSGKMAIEKIYDWHVSWFKTDHFKGCLFVRAVADLSEQNTDIIKISIAHKVWIRQLISKYAQDIVTNPALGEIIYTMIEGLISRFLVEGFDEKIADQQRKIILNLIKNHYLLW